MSSKFIWIQTGYRTFAYEGPKGLKIEQLARAVNKNKSSFYHFFADINLFIEELLQYHIHQSKIIAKKEAAAQNEIQLSKILVEHKVDLLFNRQLRFYRKNNSFKACFEKTNEITLPAFLPLWKEIIGLKDQHYLANMVLMLSLENFYLQASDENLNEAWLQGYFKRIRTMVDQFKLTNTFPLIDGSV